MAADCPDGRLLEIEEVGDALLNALGGAGATGYDGLIALIKLERQYLPGALLGINDVDAVDCLNATVEFVAVRHRLTFQRDHTDRGRTGRHGLCRCMLRGQKNDSQHRSKQQGNCHRPQ